MTKISRERLNAFIKASKAQKRFIEQYKKMEKENLKLRKLCYKYKDALDELVARDIISGSELRSILGEVNKSIK